MSSLSDVAKAAGVSVTTASLVLNGKTKQMRIAQGTAEKVLAAARKLSYFPNVSAKLLNKSSEQIEKSPEIVLLWTDALHPSFLSEFISGAQKCFKQGNVISMNINIATKSINEMQANAKDYLSYRYNGAILTPVTDSEIPLFKSIASIMPTVILHVPCKEFNNVLVDHYETGHKAACVFAKKAMKNVSIICAENLGHTTAVDLRLQGFCDACEENNMELNKIIIPDEISKLISSRSNFGKAQALSLIKKKKLPDAVFIYDDVIAVSFASTLMYNGINIPDDIEIITYGDDLLAGTISPTLTTIDYPSYEIAKASLTLLEKQMYEPYSDTQTITVKPGISYRESCPKADS